MWACLTGCCGELFCKNCLFLHEEGGVTLKLSFDLETSHLIVFFQELTDCVKEMGQNITNFEVHKDGLTKTYDLLTQQDQIPIDKLKVACEKWGENGAANKIRVVQNNAMMVKCLKATLTKATALCITPHQESFTLDMVMMESLLFKLIICLATIDSNITSKTLCTILN